MCEVTMRAARTRRTPTLIRRDAANGPSEIRADDRLTSSTLGPASMVLRRLPPAVRCPTPGETAWRDARCLRTRPASTQSGPGENLLGVLQSSRASTQLSMTEIAETAACAV